MCKINTTKNIKRLNSRQFLFDRIDMSFGGGAVVWSNQLVYKVEARNSIYSVCFQLCETKDIKCFIN